ncbi:tRNA glutamyl-Q(34) synthetase GluQRS [Marinobacter halophilus]|uniref:Glutamyl-Q tRNA(Asp) synthetase n=1 Tax=Marinobacter halophilus TaxID=1323740 RepID=A0A2T1KK04_9GAMM|nr:tRNA glutamyl-Q(34) synthetase GluQRS [Marinobacter halophilus]PSF10405.1 tRNA glutamyl-Q(34) synthetase GluQRS [Marinobacter halophilus]GGC70454.1 glutamyl-Q tRNA(Asp) synthetase [Marinobacter halophilus]
MEQPRYRGRFAPSPTGPLHFGSLVTALASWLEARAARGKWLVRIEDLDPLREPPEATGQILRSLDCHGLLPDEPVRFQSKRHDAYQVAIERLLSQANAYRCRCSRKQLQQHGGHHPAHCRAGQPAPGDTPYAIRFALNDETSQWQDLLLGPQQQQVHAELDDPVLVRKEGFYAYQLAVVVDDIDQGITDVVRGSDLLDMTAQQQQIFQALGAKPPHWLHIPVIVNDQGQKLSKQTHAPALDDTWPAANLVRALDALGQRPPATLERATVEEVLTWGRNHWQRRAIALTSRQAHDITPNTHLSADR